MNDTPKTARTPDTPATEVPKPSVARKTITAQAAAEAATAAKPKAKRAPAAEKWVTEQAAGGAASKAAKAAKPVKVEKAEKPAKPVAEPVAAKVEKADKIEKTEKVKLVRDSFTIPAGEYEALATLKQRALKGAHPVKKSELLRAGIALLASLSDEALLAALKAVPAIKTGRPKGKKGE